MPLAAFPKCFLNALCRERTMTLEQWLDMALTLDVDGQEFYSGFVPLYEPGKLRAIRRRVEDHGMSIPMLCCSPDFTQPSAAARQAEIDKEKQCIRAAAELGGRFC